jgi:hypothetical protein
MTQYLFFLHNPPDVFAGLNPAQFQEVIGKYAGWRNQMFTQGHLVGGNKLKDRSGRVIRGSAVTDGPYTESKEVVGGYFIVRAENYDAAVQLALTCPHTEYGSLEIRVIEVMN